MKSRIWIEMREALAIHDRSHVRHGGAAGVRDLGLLESAMARPRHRAAYDDEADLAELAAAHAAGIISNHPFIDGNKRTGFVVAVLFLELNGARFIASEEAASRAVLGLAEGSLDEAAFAAFLRENLAPGGGPGS